jgi:biopolymer transport protein ExbD
MRFKSQRMNPKIPTIELIPMLNVMMAVLAFFVMVSMTLTTEPEGVEVQLPGSEGEAEAASNGIPPFLARLSADGVIEVNGEALEGKEALLSEIQAYLATNETGVVLLVPDPDANYERAIQLLAEMRAVGGDRVSLGIETEAPASP